VILCAGPLSAVFSFCRAWKRGEKAETIALEDDIRRLARMNFKRRSLLFVTFFVSCVAIALLGTALGTPYWVTATCHREGEFRDRVLPSHQNFGPIIRNENAADGKKTVVECDGLECTESDTIGPGCVLNCKKILCLPFLGIARPQSQFPHSCISEGFIYSQDWSTYFFPAAE
jgi:hypothetical protein